MFRKLNLDSVPWEDSGTQCNAHDILLPCPLARGGRDWILKRRSVERGALYSILVGQIEARQHRLWGCSKWWGGNLNREIFNILYSNHIIKKLYWVTPSLSKICSVPDRTNTVGGSSQSWVKHELCCLFVFVFQYSLFILSTYILITRIISIILYR